MEAVPATTARARDDCVNWTRARSPQRLVAFVLARQKLEMPEHAGSLMNVVDEGTPRRGEAGEGANGTAECALFDYLGPR
jgi:hypothetical protein